MEFALNVSEPSSSNEMIVKFLNRILKSFSTDDVRITKLK